MKIAKKVLIAIGLIIFTIIMLVCIVVVYKAYTEPDKVPSIFGWKPFIVLDGALETNIMDGDLILVKEISPSELKKGDVIAYRVNEESVITHKIIDISNDAGKTRFFVKDNADNPEDISSISPEQVEGIYKNRIANLGKFAMNLQKPAVMVMCISLPLIILLFAQFSDYRNQEKIVREKEQIQKELLEEMKQLKKQNDELMKKK